MEGDFRNTLIIISAVIIAGIFIHGFITIRRNKNPYKLKTIDEKIDPVERGFDGSGFDQDGVSEVRVIGEQTPEEIKEELASKPVSILGSKPGKGIKAKPSFIPSIDTSQLDQDIVEDTFDYSADQSNEAADVQNDISLTDHGLADAALTDSIHDKANGNAAEKNHTDFSDEVGDDIADFDYGDTSEHDETKTVRIETPLYQTPVTQEKPKTNTISKQVVRTKKKPAPRKKTGIKRNQIELNFDDPLDDTDMPSMSAIDDAPVSNVKEIERPTVDPEVLAVSIVMPDGEFISGAALLPTLLTLGLRYGDMDIFHRHQDNAGNGKVTFSLANIMNPGTFDLDALENFQTRGLTLFMTLPNAGDSFEVFQHMLNAAKQISIEFGAQLLDDKRSVMTMQTEQHYTSKIREFERKKRIAYA